LLIGGASNVWPSVSPRVTMAESNGDAGAGRRSLARHALTMADLEATTPLVWWCALSGLLPFRIRLDAKKRRFQRFVFSFAHPITWCRISFCSFLPRERLRWASFVTVSLTIVRFFGVLLSINVVFSVASSYLSICVWQSGLERQVNHVTVVLYFFPVLVDLVPLLFLLRLPAADACAQLIGSADATLSRCSPLTCSSRRRTVIGAVLTLFYVRP